MKISLKRLAKLEATSIADAIEKIAAESDYVASGVIGSSFTCSGPGSGWQRNHDVTDYARRALDESFGADSYIDSSDGREASLDAEGDVVWSEKSVVEIVLPTVEEALSYPDEFALLQDQAADYGCDQDQLDDLAQSVARASLTKQDVADWDTVATFVLTFAEGDGQGACDVEVQIGEAANDEADGVWFLRTDDDAGGDDDCDDTQYSTEAEARAAAVAYAEQNDEGEGHSARAYLIQQRAEIAALGEDPEGEFALYWDTALDDAGERKRYSTYEAACAAADLAQGEFDGANPKSGGVTYLCGFSVRRLVDGKWMPCDENGEVRD